MNPFSGSAEMSVLNLDNEMLYSLDLFLEKTTSSLLLRNADDKMNILTHTLFLSPATDHLSNSCKDPRLGCWKQVLYKWEPIYYICISYCLGGVEAIGGNCF